MTYWLLTFQEFVSTCNKKILRHNYCTFYSFILVLLSSRKIKYELLFIVVIKINMKKYKIGKSLRYPDFQAEQDKKVFLLNFYGFCKYFKYNLLFLLNVHCLYLNTINKTQIPLYCYWNFIFLHDNCSNRFFIINSLR